MMRITNSMMSTNTKNNININKLNEDEKNTQTATGQKISRPSDDPVIAIRALRFNTTLSQLNQYHDKNIPDAEAWLQTTETALSQTDGMYTDILRDLTSGASDTNTASDRQKILANLKGIRAEFYATGNADYAGRTVFTGYRTGQPLTFLATDTDLKSNYLIHEDISLEDVKEMHYVTSADRTNATTAPKTCEETNVKSGELRRIKLAYDGLNETSGSVDIKDKDGNTLVSATVKSIAGLSQADIDDVYMSVSDDSKTSHSPAAYFIPETGEIILCKHAATSLETAEGLSVEYNKNSWTTGELRPEHFFACQKTEGGKTVNYNYNDAGEPDFKNQDIEIEVSFNQKIAINTHASDVYNHDVGRDIDDLIKATQDVVDVEEKIKQMEAKLEKAAEADKADVQKELDGLNKEYALKKDNMQKLFSKALDIFNGYADNNNKVIADIGSMRSRLKITKERVSDQLSSFKELADDNININLSDAAIDLKNAALALEAAQMAAGKIAQQTLLNYL